MAARRIFFGCVNESFVAAASSALIVDRRSAFLFGGPRLRWFRLSFSLVRVQRWRFLVVLRPRQFRLPFPLVRVRRWVFVHPACAVISIGLSQALYLVGPLEIWP